MSPKERKLRATIQKLVKEQLRERGVGPVDKGAEKQDAEAEEQEQDRLSQDELQSALELQKQKKQAKKKRAAAKDSSRDMELEAIEKDMEAVLKEQSKKKKRKAALREQSDEISQRIESGELPSRDQIQKSRSYEDVPDDNELEVLMDGEPFDMDLGKQDDLAHSYATRLAGIEGTPVSEKPKDGEDMLELLNALVDAPSPENLSDEQYEEVEDILDEWYESYEDVPIEDAAMQLASGILDVLGVEWV